MGYKQIQIGQVSRQAAKKLAAGGATQKQIAARLKISPRMAAKYLKKEIEEGQEELRRKVTGEYKKLALSNLQDYFSPAPDGSYFVDLSKASREQWACISEIVTDEYIESDGEDGKKVRKTRVKLHDKKGALDSLARTLGMFVDKTELTAEGGAPFTVVVSSVLDRKE